ncbi:MAG: DUF4276 family protein [Chloroflexi bacterium]|nr:DUF4276 family protein [Chloroflexota bacterium]
MAPHLAQFQLLVYPHLVGGNLFVHWGNDLHRLMLTNHRPNIWFSTMVDLYRLGSDFPEWAQAQKLPSAVQKVQFLEQAWHKERSHHPRFIPYIQLHEFESLLYCDLSGWPNDFLPMKAKSEHWPKR